MTRRRALGEEQLTERKHERRKNKQEASFEDILYYIRETAVFKYKRNHRTPQLIVSNWHCLPQYRVLPGQGRVLSPPSPSYPPAAYSPTGAGNVWGQPFPQAGLGSLQGLQPLPAKRRAGHGLPSVSVTPPCPPSSWITTQPLGHATCVHLYLMMCSLEQKSCSSFKCYDFAMCQHTLLFLVIALHLTQHDKCTHSVPRYCLNSIPSNKHPLPGTRRSATRSPHSSLLMRLTRVLCTASLSHQHHGRMGGRS